MTILPLRQSPAATGVTLQTLSLRVPFIADLPGGSSRTTANVTIAPLYEVNEV